MKTKRRFSYFHPYQFIWTSEGNHIVATNDSTAFRVIYKLEGKDCEGNIYSSEDKIELLINGKFDEKLMLPILGEFVFMRMDGQDANTT